MSRAEARQRDAADVLAPLRERFVLPADVIYLDGNSLGALPKATAERLRRTVDVEWGEGLIRSWNRHRWIALANDVAARIARLVGADAAHVHVGDSTSVNLYKVLSAAAQLVRPGRRTIVSERDNFPTDLYIAESVALANGLELRLVDRASLETSLDDDVAIVLLTHVNYRTGRAWPMAATTRRAHDAGALVVWDLAHSAGALHVDLTHADADAAVGCGYKYLNGGPGAPAFLWLHPRHLERIDAESMRQPLSGWLGHAAPFAFESAYRPADGIGRFTCGTPPVLSLTALDESLRVFDEAERYGGMTALRAKSVGLTTFFIDAVERLCGGLGVTLASPRDAAERGSQASFAHAGGFAVMQALIERCVIGDFRAGSASRGEPDLLRFGFAPLYNTFDEAWRAAEALADVLARETWRDARHAQRAAVT